VCRERFDCRRTFRFKTAAIVPQRFSHRFALGDFMGRCGLALLVWVLAASAANAASSDLEPVAKALATVRASKPINDERDAGPELNAVKTTLRLWAESRFERFKPYVPTSDGAFPQPASTLWRRD